MAYYPVTAWEREAAAMRASDLTIAVREDVTMRDGSRMPMLSYGHPDAWIYVEHNGQTYGVFRHDAPEARVFA